jgi:uncharacterized membrane protein
MQSPSLNALSSLALLSVASLAILLALLLAISLALSLLTALLAVSLALLLAWKQIDQNPNEGIRQEGEEMSLYRPALGY